VVEVSAGGQDYTNPDALVPKFARLGEEETFLSPVAAAEAAIAICRAWRKDGAPRAKVAYGATGGMTMPFDPCTYAEARKWAAKREEQMPRCDRCGDLLPENHFTVPEMDGERFCREYCAEEAYRGACTELVDD
jgi:hypothetical protein